MVIDAVVDPAELMIPPHVPRDQALDTGQAVIRGDSDRSGILRRGLPAMVATLLPAGHSREP